MKLSWHLYLLLPVLCLSPVNIHAQIQDNIHINGYMSMEFEKQLGDDGKGDKNASFDADLIDLVWNINATDRLRIATDMIWEHGAASEDDRGNVAIEYAFAEYTVQIGYAFVPEKCLLTLVFITRYIQQNLYF
jgi:hypothetical protein